MHVCARAKSLRLYPTLCDPMDCGSSARLLCSWILQARILTWVAMPSFRESSWPRDQTHVSLLRWQLSSLPLTPLGKPSKSYQLMIPLYVNGLNSPIKRHRVAEWVKKKTQLYAAYRGLMSALRMHIGWKWREEKEISQKWKPKGDRFC